MKTLQERFVCKVIGLVGLFLVKWRVIVCVRIYFGWELYFSPKAGHTHYSVRVYLGWELCYLPKAEPSSYDIDRELQWVFLYTYINQSWTLDWSLNDSYPPCRRWGCVEWNIKIYEINCLPIEYCKILVHIFLWSCSQYDMCRGTCESWSYCSKYDVFIGIF